MLAIVLEGGLIQSIITDDAALAARLNAERILCIDYDTEGSDPADLTPVHQDDGGIASAYVVEREVELATINTAQLLEDLANDVHPAESEDDYEDASHDGDCARRWHPLNECTCRKARAAATA
jgi:hypothetical protein